MSVIRGGFVRSAIGLSAVMTSTLVAILLASSSACTSLDGLSSGGIDPTNPPGGEAGADSAACGGADLSSDHDHCGACDQACGAMEHCLASACAPGCPDHAVYVSADGNDNNGGCTKDAPKRTVGAALALLETLAAEKHEVRICRGTYTENIVLDYPASLAGGFECTTWKRSAGYGAPTFDGVNETVVTGAAASTAPPLTVTKVSGVTVDGITFRAKDSSGDVRSVGALVTNAKVTLSNARVLAGGGEIIASPASIGIFVDAGADVIVDRTVADGGAGKNPGGGYGSAGVYLATKEATLKITESRISGGAGSVASGTGSVGVYVSEGKLTSVERSTITGGKGRTGVGSATYGLLYFATSGGDVDVVGNAIEGGTGSCPGCATTGVAISTKGRVKLHGNRITGGELVPDVADEMSFGAVRLTDFASADVQNNFLYSGNTTARFTTAGVTALELVRGTQALVANNTIGLGPSSTSKGSAVEANTPDVTFIDNVFFHAGNNYANAVSLDACTGTHAYRLRNNAWIGFKDGGALVSVVTNAGGMCQAGTAVATRADTMAASLITALGPSSTVMGSVRIAGACGSDTKCTANASCVDGPSCAPSFLTGWNGKTAGDLFGEGWKLRDGVACSLAKGGATIAGLAPTDIFGAARTEPRSLGAHEQDGACQ